MIKILHTADIHLDSPLKSLALRDETLRGAVEAATRAAFVRIVDIALSEQVAALLIAGDLFDGKERSARTAAFLLAQLDRLHTAGIRVFYIKGNHDAENPITGALELPDNVHVFDARGGKVQLSEDIWVHGVSFADRHAPESLLPRFSAPVAGALNIAMLHSSLAGAAGHDIYAPCSVTDLANMGFDYWALGHIHKRQIHAQSPWIVMPGCPQGRDIGEAGPKSASLLTLEAGKISVDAVSTSVVEFVHSSLDITLAESDEALRALLRNHLETVCTEVKAPKAVLRLTLTGNPPRYWQILRDKDIWQAHITELSQRLGELWLDKLLFEIEAQKLPRESTNASDELASMMQDLADETGFKATALAEMEAVLHELPAAVRARLVPDEKAAEALMEQLAQSGANRVLARMKGAES